MRVLFLGGDKRYLEIVRRLKDKKFDIDLVGYIKKYENINNKKIDEINICDYDVIFFPINGVMNDFIIKGEESISVNVNLLKRSKCDALIFSGIPTPCLDKILKESNREAIYLMQDKEIVLDNAVITVEGILADIINNTEISINNSNIMVIGYGNIGKSLSDALNYLKANVIVAVKEQEDFEKLKSRGMYTIYSNDINAMKMAINLSDIIINTVPSLVLNEEFIDSIKNEAYVLDISSYPYGINKEYLDKKQIKNKIYPGIPGKIAPKTAGRILTKKIEKILGGHK